MNHFTSLRIVFMGTPEFAVASLDKLVQSGCHIVSVITAPDKPGGRGMQLQQSAVKKYAVQQGLLVLQPEKLKNSEFLKELQALQADLQVVVAFRMLPEVVWNMPPMGTVNLHGSLLPQYRGAAPINWAIINGEKTTGVTTFKLQQEIDTGNILLTAIISIGEDETAGELHDRMKEIGAELLLQTIKGLADGSLEGRPQSHLTGPEGNSPAVLKTAPKIFTETCQVNWSKPVDEVYNLIRGLSPYPTAFTFLEGKKLKVYMAEKVLEAGEVDEVNGVNEVNKVDKVNRVYEEVNVNKVNRVYKAPSIAAGEFETDGKTFLRFACNDGYIAVKELQLEGKKKMMIEDFLRGFRWTV